MGRKPLDDLTFVSAPLQTYHDDMHYMQSIQAQNDHLALQVQALEHAKSQALCVS